MKNLTFATLPTLGINPLTGEACALAMRVLCDLNEDGAALLREYLGLPSTAKLADNWNSTVNDKPAVASIMLERHAFASLMRFALLRDGWPYVAGNDADNAFLAFGADDLAGNPALQMYVNGDCNVMAHMRLYRNPNATFGPVQGTRCVHQMTGRAL